MLRTHNCGELRITDINKEVSLCGWIQRIRDKGKIIWIDLRDRYGITQLIFEDGISSRAVIDTVRGLGREFVISVAGKVQQREAKNPNLSTGEVEINVSQLKILNSSLTPPFTIEDETDGGEELRMKYRYIDLRRNPVKNNLIQRHKVSLEVRKYLDSQCFIEIETPFLVKSTPEGARDFVVPSRVNSGEFYALPQSPQTFKQLLMVSGFDRYFQIVKCFRDEDLRADRQPEFTQIDCEMSFIDQEDILNMFESMVNHLFKTIKGIELGSWPRITYADAMNLYGSDKPDIRFNMKFINLTSLVQNRGFSVFDNASTVVAIVAEGCSEYTRKQLDELTDFVKRPQIGMNGLIYVKNSETGIKSSVDKFFTPEDITQWLHKAEAKIGDLLLIMAGDTEKTLKAMGELRLEMGKRLNMRNKNIFKPLWVLDFPLLEWDDETSRFYAMHHPFTSPKPEDIALLDSDPKAVRANAYDMVFNGVEIGGGSIRIHNKQLQQKMFSVLGFSPEEAQRQFGFLMNAFEYGAPPHGGIALGFDRLNAMFGGQDSIRDFIAFPKNNAGKDVMIDAPSALAPSQLKELSLLVKKNE